MAKVYYPNYNGVFSTLHDTIERPQEVDAGADTILIAGVAKKGPMNRHVTVDDTNILEVYGDTEGMTPDEFQRSAVKGFYEVRAAQIAPSNIALMRVGNARRGGLRLFENRHAASGDLAPTDPTTGYTTAVLIEALEDGNQEFSIDVDANDQGQPISARCRMPYINEDGEDDIQDEMYALDVDGNLEGAFYKPSQLAGAINSDPVFSQQVFAGVPLLNKVTTVEVIQASGLTAGIPQKTYEVSDDAESYGDKLYAYNKIYSYKDITETVLAGTSTFTAANLPNKTSDESSPTISTAYVDKASEILVQNVTISQVGGNAATLKCALDNTWDNTTPGEEITDYSLYIIRGGVTTTMVETTDYTIDTSTGDITFLTGGGLAVEGGFAVGDVIGANYKYKVSLTESKNRSELIRGNKRSYFVIGKEIIFGDPSANDVIISYESIVEYEVGADVVVGDPLDEAVDGYKDNVFTFINAANLPDVGDTLYIDFDYEPELPAATGYIFPDNVTTQLGGLTGGSAGTAMGLYDYKKSISDAFNESENYPCRYIVVQGAYFDDTLDGYNAETGMPEVQNVGWHTMLKTVSNMKSNYVSECEAILTHTALVSPDSPGAYNAWLQSVSEVSVSDSLRAANISKTMTDFRMSIVAGEVLGSGVSGRGTYPLYTPNILVAMKSELPIGETLTHKQLPGNVIGMRYLIKSAKDIDLLNGMRYTTLGIEIENVLDQTLSPVKIMDAPTMATEGSQFDRQFTYGAIIEGLRIIRRTLKPFIGKVLDNALLTTINARLNTTLQVLVPDVLRAFVIEVKSSRGQMLKGTSAVTFHGVTGSEVRRFEVDATASKIA